MANRSLVFKPKPALGGVVIVIPKRVARLAVQRNKLRRRLQEIIRRDIAPKRATSLSGTLYTHTGATERTFAELQSELIELLGGAK